MDTFDGLKARMIRDIGYRSELVDEGFQSWMASVEMQIYRVLRLDEMETQIGLLIDREIAQLPDRIKEIIGVWRPTGDTYEEYTAYNSMGRDLIVQDWQPEWEAKIIYHGYPEPLTPTNQTNAILQHAGDLFLRGLMYEGELSQHNFQAAAQHKSLFDEALARKQLEHQKSVHRQMLSANPRAFIREGSTRWDNRYGNSFKMNDRYGRYAD